MRFKIFTLSFCALLALCYCANIDQPAQNTSNDKAVLLQSIHTFNQAFKTGDIDALQAMITNNYQHTNGTSKVIGKSNWLAYLRKRSKAIEAGTLVVTDYKMEETHIELFGHTAIVTAKIAVNSTQEGNPKENEYRVTNIWVKEKGRWKRAGFHDGKIR